MRYLAYVAQKENVHVEDEALRVVASKADGALRDALSIFDQLVSFSGKNITYHITIQHLNVLDVDNYFKMTDFLFSEDNSAALLLFDDILNRGFDGQHFISGLAAHFRLILMSQNPSTIKLMEVSDAVKARFFEQAKKADKQLLLRGLELANQCDFNYKLSQNKRLSVEICLMQINGNYMYKLNAGVRQSREN
jgi:DNA polymerase-3 subunit gamma/tau